MYHIFPVVSQHLTTENVERNEGGRLTTRNLYSKYVHTAICFAVTAQMLSSKKRCRNNLLLLTSENRLKDLESTNNLYPGKYSVCLFICL